MKTRYDRDRAPPGGFTLIEPFVPPVGGIRAQLVRTRAPVPEPRSSARCKAGFTLIELLVVMAIISALAAMLVPAVSRARGQALCAVCQSNLHQVGIALARHTLDYGHYPQFGLQSTDNPWGKQIGEYLGYVKAVNVCPAFPEARRKTPEGQVVIVTYSYGWNAWGSGIGGDFGLDLGAPIFAARKGLSDMEVVTPHDMIAFGDSEPNSFFGGILIPTFGLDMGGFIESFGPSRRHLEGANMVFCDGHVEYGKNPDWVAHQDPVMRRWNRDHQPHPETWDMDLTQF